MEYTWIEVIYFLFLFDSVCAVLLTWVGRRWWLQQLGWFAKYFPPAKGWTLLYFILIVIIGHLVGVL